MSNIVLSAFADEYNRDPKIHAKFLESRGVHYIEPRFVNGVNVSEMTEREVKEYATLLSDHGIAASAIGSPIGKINLADDFDTHMELAKRCFNYANLMGAPRIRVFSFYLREGQSRDDAREEVIDKLGSLIKLADDFGVTLCHENEAKIYGESPERCHEILSCFAGKLKAVYDMGNFVLDGYDPYPTAYELLKPYIEYFHIKDGMSVGAIVPAGCGDARIADILSAHKAYSENDFFISLEPHLETFAGLNKLVGKSFDNPYKFESAEAAFTHALDCIEEICRKI